jgi:glycosyltransferase involved in cell wall biosynthesis
MKILQVINSLDTGGAEKLILDTLPLYRARGIDMDVLLFWNNHHQFAQKLIDLNICKVHVIHNSNQAKDVYKPSNILAARAIIKQYDIAHVHLFPAQYFVPLANIMNGHKTQLIFTEHNTTNRRIEKPLFRIIDKYFYKQYQKHICISEEIKNIFQKQYQFPDAFYAVIHNGVDLQKIQKAQGYNKPELDSRLTESDRVVVQVSAFRTQKDQDTLIKAMQELPDSFKLILVGEGERKATCEALVSTLALNNRVFFLGARMDVPEILKTADYIVLSSKYEGLSLASIEGLGSGKPFIASDVPGLQTIVSGAGVLFPLGNHQALAAEVMRLENDSIYKQETITKSLQRAQPYDISSFIEAHIKLYTDLCRKQ